MYNISGVNQTCVLRRSLADVVAAEVDSVAIFMMNAFGCGTIWKFPSEFARSQPTHRDYLHALANIYLLVLEGLLICSVMYV